MSDSPRRRPLGVQWFGQWVPELDDALAALPEGDYPHELHRLMAAHRVGAPKEIALVHHRGQPVAVIALRRCGRLAWEPANAYLVPGAPFPAVPGRELEALTALGREVRVGWWRTTTASATIAGGAVHQVTETPVHGMAMADDAEAYWRAQGNMKTVKKARTRCAELTMTVDAPGAADWLIRGSGRQWSGSLLIDGVTADRLAVAAWLEQRGLHHTLLLSDGEVPVAAASLLVHGDSGVASLMHRDRAYDALGAGSRLIDWSFDYTRQQGLVSLDIGGGHDYKRRWAPVAGARWDITVSTPMRRRARQSYMAGRRFVDARRGAGSLTMIPPLAEQLWG